MSKLENLESNIIKLEFDVPINNSIDKVWALLSEQVDTWWMNDFRVLGENSTMSLDLHAGGSLIETDSTGATLEWYRVQMVVPMESIYLVGYLAPDWGGPTVSMLKLALQTDGETCILNVSDGLLGNVSEKQAANVESGWKQMFADGFKQAAEPRH